jgi:hypothetical protein
MAQHAQPTDKYRPGLDYFRNDPNPKTIQLRDACISLLRILIAYDKSPREQAHHFVTPLSKAADAIREFGITPGIHSEKSPADKRKSPLILAEYVAGTLLNVIPNIEMGTPNFQEVRAGGESIPELPGARRLDLSGFGVSEGLLRASAVAGAAAHLAAELELLAS